MIVTDAFGRDLAYLRSAAPTPPPRWALCVNLVWPLFSFRLWRDRVRLEAAAVSLDHPAPHGEG